MGRLFEYKKLTRAAVLAASAYVFILLYSFIHSGKLIFYSAAASMIMLAADFCGIVMGFSAAFFVLVFSLVSFGPMETVIFLFVYLIWVIFKIIVERAAVKFNLSFKMLIAVKSVFAAILSFLLFTTGKNIIFTPAAKKIFERYTYLTYLLPVLLIFMFMIYDYLLSVIGNYAGTIFKKITGDSGSSFKGDKINY